MKTVVSVDHWLRQFPEPIRSAAAQLSQAHLDDDVGRLLQQIDEHMHLVANARKTNEFLDQDAAARAVELARQIVRVTEQIDGTIKDVALIAVHYFLSADDAEPDFDSPNGFDDDLMLLDSAADILGFST